MKRHIMLISAFSFLMLAPGIQHQIYGEDANSPAVVNSNVVVNDDNLEDTIENAIESDMALAKAADDVDVDVDNGVVTLSGDVASDQIKSAVEAKVKNMVGVKQVVNNIQVKS
jgi:osmotically-inducible protein OsmY